MSGEVSTRGVGYTKHLDLTQTRGVYESPVENWNFLYQTSLTKPAGYNIGDRVCLPDGRVFRLTKATNIINCTQFGLKFWQLQSDGIGYKTPTQAELSSSMEVTVDAGKSVAKDVLRGGYVTLHTHPGSTDPNNQVTRGIVGNTESDSNEYVTIYIDAPWAVAIETSYGIEACPNPYASVRLTAASGGYVTDEYTSVAGMPGVKTVAANQYLWLQTWGPIWINPHANPGKTVNDRQVIFDKEGRISLVGAAVGASNEMQIAGFIISKTSAALASGFIMLQISP